MAKFHNNWGKIVDFLLSATFGASVIFFGSYFSSYLTYHLIGKLIPSQYVLWNPHTLLTIPHIFPIYLIRNVIFYCTTFIKCLYLTYHHSYLFETPNSYFFEYPPLYIHILLNLVHTLLTSVHTLLTIVHTLLWYQIIIPYLPTYFSNLTR